MSMETPYNHDFLKRYKKGRDSQQGKLFPSFGSLFNHRVLLTLVVV